MIMLIAINVFGTVANGVLLVTTLAYGPLRNSSSSILWAHCILIDLFMTLISEPGFIMITYLGPQHLASDVCRKFGTILFGSIFLVNWTHAVLAVNRFVASIFPHQYKRLTKRSSLIMAVTFPWVLSILLNIFPVAEIGMRYAPMVPWSGCIPTSASPIFKAPLFLSVFGVYIPCSIIGLCYSTVMIRFRWTSYGKSVEAASSTQKRYNIAKMLFGCFLWNCLANFILLIAMAVAPTKYFASPLTQLGLKSLQYVSSAVNPVFFALISETYRDGIAATIFRKPPHKISPGLFSNYPMTVKGGATAMSFRAFQSAADQHKNSRPSWVPSSETRK